ncbi:hypothetical protein HMPREF0290_0804 [Corynebacterium efficiens YS-314]|uniref:DUF3515 domain-containing protein n=1 Tax=Corynebacterium efficiens (strain DSM 44549 / YS-314 / AJ 12310 / JCM 11189 / NBRC 100395) TaxID=196164 RepID=Q8FPQ7_COREF|nr:DUF3515 domain-containing protein [Corynebacterium efficiens]EEW50577.1 hypothetical protein HMPREF0290_0804 [Corynebacterium efficiens YS-314]BAC18243.1 hypothetical protein [Corynebacterium efficiens YS-314]
MNKTPIVIALVLSLLLTTGVLVGARVLLGPAGQQQVAMSTLPAPEAESAECAALIESLPDSAFGHTRAQIIEPVPAGVAAWASSELERVTLRCGVDMPFQYTELAETVEVDGVTWLPVADVTAGSSLQTWYSVDRFPVVAITADDMSTGNADNPVAPFTDAVGALDQREGEPFPAPLSQLAASGSGDCSALIDALPATLEVGSGEDAITYQLIDDPAMAAAGYGDDAVAWQSPGLEPIVIRCGVEPSENYEAGAVLQQINDIPWFEDTILATGTTSATWYALGRETDIAVSLPQYAGGALVQISEAIEEHVPAA